MLKLGDKTINKLYLGDKKITKAFLGEKLVFESLKPIFLEYIEIGVSGQYIDTEIVLNYNHKVTAVVKPVDDGKNLNHIIFGNLVDINKGFSCSCANKVINSRFDGTLYADNLYRGGDTPHTYTVDKNGIVIDDEPIKTWQGTPSEFTTIGTCILSGNRSTNGQPGNYMGVGSRIYDFKIWENDILVQHLRPCVHPKTFKACVYDTVSHKYLYNQGTGEFIPAPRFVEYIQSTGTQYIDTGIEATSITRFVVKGTCETNGYSNAQLLGTQNTSAITFFGSRYMSSTRIKSWYCMNAESVSLGNPTNLSIIDCIIESRTSQYGTLTDLVTNNISEFTYLATVEWGFTSGNLLLFGGESNRVSPNATCYSLQLYTANGLVRDLRPCIDANGVACMYDMVTKKYLYNQGFGEFISGDIL